MKLITFLAVLAGLGFVTTNSIQTRITAEPDPASALAKRGAHLIWKPADARKRHRATRLQWEERCQKALAKENCGAGIIHRGQISVTKSYGKTTYYVNVEGAPSMDMMHHAKKMRVFQDGSHRTVKDWSPRDWRLMEAKLHTKKITPVREGQKALLSWDPIHSYEKQGKRKLFWEEACQEALIREGCNIGRIHVGEITATRKGRKTLYVNVEGAPSPDMMGNPKKMRVFQDASSEDFTRDGWTPEDWTAMEKAKRNRRRQQRKTIMKQQAPAPEHIQEGSKPSVSISWDPPNAYQKRYPRLRHAWEKACQQALEREGCEFGIIYKGQHWEKKPNGTKSFYMTVSAGKHENPDDAKLMRLFEDGESMWYPLGHVIPTKDVRGEKGRRLNPDLRVPYSGPGGRAKAWERNKLGQFRGRGGGKYQDSATFAPNQENAQGGSKRRRVGGDDYQFSATPAPIQAEAHVPEPALPPARAGSPQRFQAPGRPDFDLNFPPTG